MAAKCNYLLEAKNSNSRFVTRLLIVDMKARKKLSTGEFFPARLLIELYINVVQ